MAVTPLPVPDGQGDNEILEFDVNNFTFGEIEQIEEIVGRDVMHELGRGKPSVKTVLAMIYVVKRRTDPTFTLEEARAMKVNAITFETPPDPKEPAG